MSALRQRFRVAWDDQPAVEVRTNARDLASAQDFADDPTTAAVALVHHALVRTGVAVPDLEQFLDVLDDMEALDADSNGAAAVDPT